MKPKPKITVIKGPYFEKALQNTFVYINQMLRKKLQQKEKEGTAS